METTNDANDFEKDIAAIVAQLPPAIRAFFLAGKVEAVAGELMGKYRLHVDQAAVLEREMIQLLLGLETPEEFFEALARDAGISPDQINSIANDVNDRIFVPLRQEMQKEERGASAPAPAQPAVATPSYGTSAPKASSPAPMRVAPQGAPVAQAAPAKIPEPLASPLGAAIRAAQVGASTPMQKTPAAPAVVFNTAPAPRPAAPAQVTAPTGAVPPAPRMPILNPERELPTGMPPAQGMPAVSMRPASAPQAPETKPATAPLPPKFALPQKPQASTAVPAPRPAIAAMAPAAPSAPQTAPQARTVSAPGNLPGTPEAAPLQSDYGMDPYREPLES